MRLVVLRIRVRECYTILRPASPVIVASSIKAMINLAGEMSLEPIILGLNSFHKLLSSMI